MKKKYDSDIKNNVNKLLDRIIIVLIVLIVISGVFLLIRKEEYNKTVIEVNDSKLSVGAIEKEISVKEEIDSLKKKYKNNDVIGILSIDDEINTPIAQTKDNQFYLKKSLSLQRSVLGAVFMDYRVNKDSKQINIYGHNSTKYKPPFNALEGYLKEDYFNEHKSISLKIDNEIKKYEIFSIVLADKKSTEEHMNLNYKKDSDWLSHFNRLKKRSIYKTNIELNENDKVLVLQTCLFGKYKGKLMVVVARLVEE